MDSDLSTKSLITFRVSRNKIRAESDQIMYIEWHMKSQSTVLCRENVSIHIAFNSPTQMCFPGWHEKHENIHIIYVFF